MPLRWKLFRIVCALQALYAGLLSAYALYLLLFPGFFVFRLLNVVCFTAIALFAGLGLSLINRNYPDTRPQGAQKRYFNILYILNILVLPCLAALIWSDVRTIMWLLALNDNSLSIFWFITPLIGYSFLLISNIYLLYMMFRLRRELYANYLRMIDSIGSEIK